MSDRFGRRWCGMVLVALLLVAAGAYVRGAAAREERPLASLSWRACGQRAQSGFECATARVPLDYARSGGRLIRLAVIRHRAEDSAHRLGSLFFNPGGPGGAGTQDLPSWLGLFPAALRRRFDLVSWDPRGVGASTAVQCFASARGGGGALAGFTGGGGAPSAKQRLGRRMMLAAGWGPEQWPALRALWTKESGWDANAVNRSSGAAGIPQALGHGHVFNLGDAAAQIRWGLNYIRNRYGSPQAAWAHSQATNWYQTGGRVSRDMWRNGVSRSEWLGLMDAMWRISAPQIGVFGQPPRDDLPGRGGGLFGHRLSELGRQRTRGGGVFGHRLSELDHRRARREGGGVFGHQLSELDHRRGRRPGGLFGHQLSELRRERRPGGLHVWGHRLSELDPVRSMTVWGHPLTESQTGGRVMAPPDFGGWFAAGGRGTFRRPTLIGVGDAAVPERVTVQHDRQRAGQRGGGGGGDRTMHVTMHVHGDADGHVRREVHDAFRDLARELDLVMMEDED